MDTTAVSLQLLPILFWVFFLNSRVRGECDSITNPGGLLKFTSDSCGLTDFPGGGVPWNVSEVDLSNNSIVYLTTPIGFPELVIFTADTNLMDEFPNLTSFKSTLERLSLVSNQISYIDPDFLNVLVKLLWLDLTSNLLSTIPDVAGPSLLNFLSLKWNQFTVFPTLTNLGRALTTFNIKRNSLTGCVPGNNTFPKLESLYMFLNLIDCVNIPDNDTFPRITFLEISGVLDEFPDLTHVGDTLTTLHLSPNRITDVPIHISKWLVGLTNLGIKHNWLTEFPDCSPFGNTLTTLNLHVNRISSILPRHTEALSVISSLTISYNWLTTLPNFGQLSDTLVTLVIHNNPLDNPVEEIVTLFKTIANPQLSLDISDEPITNVPSSVCEGKIFANVQLSGTNLICDCRLRWLKVATLSGMSTDIEATSTPCLGGPAELRNETWADLTLSRLQCNGRTLNQETCMLDLTIFPQT